MYRIHIAYKISGIMCRYAFCAYKLYFLMSGHKLQLKAYICNLISGFRVIGNNPLTNMYMLHTHCYVYVHTLEYRCVFTFTDSIDPMVTISAITSICPWHINTSLVVIRTQCLVIRAFIDICKPFSHNKL